MKHLIDKNMMKTISFIVLLMTSVVLIAMPIQPLQAQSTETISGDLPVGITPNAAVPAKAYLSFKPNPVGVNQSFLVNLWVTPAPGASRSFKDFTVTLTKPDGTKDVITMDSYIADGTAWFEYIADQAGTWKLKFEFPGNYFPSINIPPDPLGPARTIGSAYYEPSATKEQELTVQQEQVMSWPASSLPTDYWTRPVAFEHREWWTILGDYPWRGPGDSAEWNERYPNTEPNWNENQNFIPWVQAPNSAHVVWKREGGIGGLVGAGYSQENFVWPWYSPNMPTIIFQGRCYQTTAKLVDPYTNFPSVSYQDSILQCYDLRTGKVYWELENVPEPTVIEYGAGGEAVPGGQSSFSSDTVFLVYIGQGRLIKYNPFTGGVVLNVSISPLTTGTYYRDGFVLSVQDLGSAAGAQRYRLINWTTIPNIPDLASRIQSNITFALPYLPATTDFGAGITTIVNSITEGGAFVGQSITAVSLSTGQVLWSITNDEPYYSGSCDVADHGKIAILSARGYFLAYDLYSGKLAWKSETMDYPWDEPGWGSYSIQSAYGMFFREAYSGVYAFDWNTGNIVWKYEAPALSQYESEIIGRNGTTVYPFNAPALIADGKMYVYNAEHTPDSPNNRGWATHCINITTGEPIWKIMIAGGRWSPTSEMTIADGYLTLGSNDGPMYVFGKGKSAATVMASPKVTVHGSKVLIEGTVLDMSPAQTGTPCVSKESMALQMEYLHKQMPIAGIWGNETITGVPVSLDAIDPNGNSIHIADVTTDGYSGTFGYTWQPEIPGQYMLTATFTSDDSYSSSFATTYVSISEAPSASITPTSTPIANPPYELYTIGMGIAIIVAFTIAVLLLRKKP